MCRNYNSNKRSIWTTIVIAVLCLVIVTGSTFSLFTSKSGTDIAITSGNLDMTAMIDADSLVLYSMGAQMTRNFANGGYAAFNDAKTELSLNKITPGDSARFNIVLTNNSNIDFKYRVTCEVEGILSEILVATVNSTLIVSGQSEWMTWNEQGNTKILAIEISLPTGLFGDDFSGYDAYMGQSATIAFAVEAVQANGVEEYEESINPPKIPTVVEQVEAPAIDENGATTESVEIEATDKGVSATIPEGVKLAEGAEELTLSIKEIADSQANVEINEAEETKVSLDVHIEGISEENDIPMAIKLDGVAPKGLNDSNIKLYHVENGVTVQMTQIGMADEFTAHNQFKYDAVTGDLILNLASFSEVAVVSDTIVHWDGKSATAFAGGSGTEADPYLIANASQLAFFRDVVDGKVEWSGDASFEDQYVKLTSNIFLNHEGEFTNLFDPIGWGYSYSPYNRGGAEGRVFKGTFDGGNYSIHGLWQNGWDLEAITGTDYTYTNCGAGLFASAENATFKNLAIIDFVVTFECVEEGLLVGLAQGNCTFENIYVFDSKIANYQRPAGGIVGEISPSYTADGKAIECTFNFKNIVIDTSVVVGTLWGDFDAPVGGVIGARWDDSDVSKVVMEDVNVACELDVYNDVTSTYQWYAYRRAGMLIGNTDTAKTTDGRTVATADFLTCVTKNGIPTVNVYYTNWAKYNYCQFTNHNSSWPWVRVQAGENCNAYSNPRYGVPNDMNGNKVVDYNHKHADGDQCNVQIYFNQLYGGGQGVYGQPAHDGVNTDVKYLITFIHQDHVGGIQFITEYNEDPNGDGKHDVMFPDLTKLPHLDQSKGYEWVNRNGEVVNTSNESIPVGNQRDIFYYLTYSNQYYVHFVDKDGFQVARIQFNPKTGELINGVAPEYPPEVPGYYGFWEPYVLKGATHDVIVNAVYSKRETASVLEDADDLFTRIARGHELSMSNDLTGGFGNASKNVFCDVASTPDIAGDTAARFDLNSFTLEYNGNNSGNKDWTLFLIRENRKLTVGDGFAGFGFLYFDFSKLNSGSKPTIFALEKGATLILERGVVIELRYPKNNSNTINAFKGVGDLSQYSGLQIENIKTDSENILRITVNARTVLTGDGSYNH